MIVHENECVDCGLPCIGSLCSYSDVVRRYCDICGEPAEYIVDNVDMCEDCANKVVDEEFKGLTYFEKCELLEFEYKEI